MAACSRLFPLGPVLVVCLLVAMTLLALVPASAGATFAGKNGLFAFGMVDEYESLEEDAVVTATYIGLATRDGRQPRKVAPGASPAFSPGGRMLVASGLRRRGIVLRGVDGSFVKRLTHGRDGEPAWSPSGRRIAFTRGIDAEYYELRFESAEDIYTIARDGNNPTLLVAGGEDPAWSSRGEIAFVLPDDPDDREEVREQRPPSILAMSANGGPARTLATDGFSPDWSPSGGRLAFVRFGSSFNPHNKLFVVNRDGTGLLRIYRSGGDLLSPTWSPDGRTIAFLEGDEVLVVPANGGRARRFLRLPWRDMECDFCQSWLKRPETLAWQPLRVGR
jgi:dipeptidyl aminopeptidase/acylaminoacyl peptidase